MRQIEIRMERSYEEFDEEAKEMFFDALSSITGESKDDLRNGTSEAASRLSHRKEKMRNEEKIRLSMPLFFAVTATRLPYGAALLKRPISPMSTASLLTCWEMPRCTPICFCNISLPIVFFNINI
ncbi:MAG: hypothetical protein Q7J31_03250 [Syntrophales bacterium]|nr:hypothetical protein [Syntrophales bacterium]